MMNEPLIIIPDLSLSIEDLMTLQLDADAPDEDSKIVQQVNNASYQWFNDQIDTEHFLDLVEENLRNGVDDFLDQFDQVLRSI